MARFRFALRTLGLSLAAMTLAAGGQAAAQCVGCVQTTINYTIFNLRYDVTNIVVFGETNDGAIDQLGPYSAPRGASVIAADYGVTPPIVSTFMMGVTTEAPGEPSGAVVLFTNNGFATANVGQNFNSIFSDLLATPHWYTDQGVAAGYKSIADESSPPDGETTLIADLRAWTGVNPDLDFIHFSGGDINGRGVSGAVLYGAIASVGFAPGDTFTAIAFSDGRVIGSGTTGVIPEPAAWSLMLLGFGGLGARLRARRREVLA